MKIINTVLVVALMMGGLRLHAQEFSVEYTTELQTELRECNFINLLKLNAEVPLSRSLTLKSSTISIAKTREDRLIDDLQTYSNIEEGNLPLAISVCGVQWQIDNRHSIFFGIRNMNEDYFTSTVTSFYTNSSCGIYPTISANYPIANYPTSSVGIHYEFMTDNLGVKASLYNGIGYNHITGPENIFRFCPGNDGVLFLTELQYSCKGNMLFIGNSLYQNNGVSTSPWVYTEQSVSNELSLIAGYSHAFSMNSYCNDFVGLGLHLRWSNQALGIFTDYARFADSDEYATEVTYWIQATRNIYVQPTLHLIDIHFGEKKNSIKAVGLIRFGITL